ncbi:MAG: hypothetical protein HOP37_11185 [Cyclobacteriaceae bacterium]|nr:hypothetical protein [Cyclobacteriaceae bacterium]
MLYASSGLMLVGLGLSMAIDAGFKRYGGEPWFFYGAIALIVFNSGISLFGQAVIEFIRWKNLR